MNKQEFKIFYNAINNKKYNPHINKNNKEQLEKLFFIFLEDISISKAR